MATALLIPRLPDGDALFPPINTDFAGIANADVGQLSVGADGMDDDITTMNQAALDDGASLPGFISDVDQLDVSGLQPILDAINQTGISMGTDFAAGDAALAAFDALTTPADPTSTDPGGGTQPGAPNGPGGGAAAGAGGGPIEQPGFTDSGGGAGITPLG